MEIRKANFRLSAAGDTVPLSLHVKSCELLICDDRNSNSPFINLSSIYFIIVQKQKLIHLK